MTINLTNNELKTLRRLGNALSSDVIPVGELRGFISGLEQKVAQPVGTAVVRGKGIKERRKEEFRQKLHRA